MVFATTVSGPRALDRDEVNMAVQACTVPPQSPAIISVTKQWHVRRNDVDRAGGYSAVEIHARRWQRALR